MVEVVLRDAGPADAALLAEMLAVAVDWRPGTPVRPAADVLADPLLARYVAGWPRPGDAGVVAEAGRAEGGAVGAAWWRFFTAGDPGYGFVDEAFPEVSVGVREGWRGAGVGGRLLRSLVARARSRGLAGLSLSVETGNDAARLYRRLGFETAGRDRGALTMVLRLPSGGPAAG